MEKIENYETRKGKSRHMEVKIKCENCGNEKWVRWIRVKNGQGRFCGLGCANEFQKEEGMKTWGEENATFHWDKGRGCWYAFWKDKDTGSQKSTTKTRWLWEKKYGKLTPKDVVTYIDGNSENCELDNLKVISRSESNSIHLMGHKVTDEARKKMSEYHSSKTLSEDHKLKIGNSVRKRWDEGEFDSIHVGKNNKNWRGGVENIYPKEFNNALKARIKDRDNHKCRLCDNGEIRLEVHHIDGNRNNNQDRNLITFCVDCHHLAHNKVKTDDPEVFAFRSVLYQDNL